jgi:hypothetical protein
MLGHVTRSGGASYCLVRVYVWCKCNTVALGYMTCHTLVGKQPYNHLSNDITCALSNYFSNTLWKALHLVGYHVKLRLTKYNIRV